MTSSGAELGRGLARPRCPAMRARHLISLGLVVLFLPGAGAHAAPVSRAFFGVVPQDAVGTADLDRMAGSFGTLRIGIFWPEIEPEPGAYDFTSLDEEVRSARQAGLRVLPFVYGSPPWISGDPMRPPIASAFERQAWAGFLRTLVGRYGPDGSVWGGRSPSLSVRDWQIWNEPNFVLFWHPRPEPVEYVKLLRASARVIRRADPGSRIVAAGLAPVGAGIMPPEFMARMYRVPGARDSFDVAALHPYATALFGVEYYVRQARHVMAKAGDAGKPLLISELGVASDAERPTAFDKGLEGQAEFLRRSYSLLLRNRLKWRIAGIDWYTWRDGSVWDPHCSFCEFAGLFDRADRPKPAWSQLQRIVGAAVR